VADTWKEFNFALLDLQIQATRIIFESPIMFL